MTSTGDVARDAALLHLARQAARFPDLDLRQLKVSDRAAPRDAALAHAIADAATTRWLTLACCIARFSAQPWEEIEPALQGALLGGAAQVLMLDRVPAYAAIDHAVQWSKVNVRAGAAGLTNAVLRRVAALRLPPERQGAPAQWDGQRDALPLAGGGVLCLAEPVLPEPAHARLGLATSHPRAIVEAWAGALGPTPEGELALRRRCLHTLAQPPIIVNAAHAAPGQLPDRPDLFRRHGSPGHLVFLGATEQLAEVLGTSGSLWVQDPASSDVVTRLAAHCAATGRRPKVIADLCAGQGTKTRQLAACFPDAELLATDTDDRRREVLQETARTIEHARAGPRGAGAAAPVRVLRPEELLLAHARRADIVLLDVPCSNSGVLPRRPEARYRFSPASLAELVELQRAIIVQGAGVLAGPGSLLVYSTCSLERQENSAQAAWACAGPPAPGVRLKLLAEHQTLPAGLPGGDAAEYHDGAYSAFLERV